MDHKTLISTLSQRLNQPREDVEELCNTFSRCVGEATADFDSVNIPAFGVFEPRKRAERIIAQPNTGKRLLVPPKVVIAFKPSAILKQKIK